MKSHLVLTIILVIAAFLAGSLLFQNTVYLDREVQLPPEIITVTNSGTTFSTLRVPAVDPSGKGVSVRIDVQARPGTGRILANIDKILFWVDTQDSIRTARSVAEDVTGIDLDSYDLTYAITANASVIEGPSAGAAITVATIAAVQNMTLDPRVTITGSIEEDGSIGSAGGILEKARAARDSGSTIFLIPEGTASTEGAERVKNCTVEDSTEYCAVEYVPKKADISNEANINVHEVKTIEEAMEYFL